MPLTVKRFLINVYFNNLWNLSQNIVLKTYCFLNLNLYKNPLIKS